MGMYIFYKHIISHDYIKPIFSCKL